MTSWSGGDRLGPRLGPSEDPRRNRKKSASSLEASGSDLQRDMNNADGVGSGTLAQNIDPAVSR